MPFFWDTIQLSSKHASWFFENHLKFGLLPDEIDSGHPPFVGYYLAYCWDLFGRTLPVSHAAFMPFVFYIAVCCIQFVLNNSKDPLIILPLSVFLLSDPILWAQASIMSPDIILIAGFLLIFTFRINKPVVFLGAIFLAAVSSRGAMLLAACMMIECVRIIRNSGWNWLVLIKSMLPYIPGALVFLLFNIWHYNEKGWIGYHADSPWAPHFETVGITGFLKNILNLGWRMMDFGRVIILAFVCLVALFFGNTWKKSQQDLLIYLGIMSLFLLPSFLIYSGLNAHRYVWPLMLVFNFMAVKTMIDHLDFKRLLRTSLVFVFVNISAHLWVYPDKISQGWDVTLAHVPYHVEFNECLEYVEKMGIERAEIGTAFPATNSAYHIWLGEDKIPLRSKDMDKDKFILYSNVMNDFTDGELEKLKSDYAPVYYNERNRIKVVLYKKSE
jgi:hypothetical protein